METDMLNQMVKSVLDQERASVVLCNLEHEFRNAESAAVYDFLR